eukprot:6199706-Pleurochrysis_carterae.AAC.2
MHGLIQVHANAACCALFFFWACIGPLRLCRICVAEVVLLLGAEGGRAQGVVLNRPFARRVDGELAQVKHRAWRFPASQSLASAAGLGIKSLGSSAATIALDAHGTESPPTNV